MTHSLGVSQKILVFCGKHRGPNYFRKSGKAVEISFMVHWYVDPPNSYSNTVILILRSISVQIVVKTQILLNRRLCLLYLYEKGLHTHFYTAFSTWKQKNTQCNIIIFQLHSSHLFLPMYIYRSIISVYIQVHYINNGMFT